MIKEKSFKHDLVNDVRSGGGGGGEMAYKDQGTEILIEIFLI